MGTYVKKRADSDILHVCSGWDLEGESIGGEIIFKSNMQCSEIILIQIVSNFMTFMVLQLEQNLQSLPWQTKPEVGGGWFCGNPCWQDHCP